VWDLKVWLYKCHLNYKSQKRTKPNVKQRIKITKLEFKEDTDSDNLAKWLPIKYSNYVAKSNLTFSIIQISFSAQLSLKVVAIRFYEEVVEESS
jgi:hypothetical protein